MKEAITHDTLDEWETVVLMALRAAATQGHRSFAYSIARSRAKQDFSRIDDERTTLLDWEKAKK